ncbi:hypothetical protein GALLN_00788 [Gallionellaceae bacterium]|nr:hypothetical protein GALLN_00788 [Gallionellaceae bacterium]
MLPPNLLTALKAYAQSQKPLPTAADDAALKTTQFEAGQKLQGSVQAQIASGLFKVQVAGQLVQMQLPPSIRSGDTVALQVISTQPRLTFSMVNSANPLSTPEQLGSVARLLSSMSQQAPEKAYVRAAQRTPLWETPQPPAGKELAGLLKEALSNSGLFYESHQVQWLEGSRSTAQLMHEPQNQVPGQPRLPGQSGQTGLPGQPLAAMAHDSTGKAAITAHQEPVPPAMAQDNAGKSAMAHTDSTRAVITYNTTGGTVIATDSNSSPAAATSTAQANATSQPGATTQPDSKPLNIPEHLQPLVQQQLNALETRQMLWQGNVWPGQDMRWEIHEQPPQTAAEEEQRQWVTQLQLDLPTLGEVTATLRFNSAGLSLMLNAAAPETRAVLGSASTQLVAALSDAGIQVLGAQVTQLTSE